MVPCSHVFEFELGRHSLHLPLREDCVMILQAKIIEGFPSAGFYHYRPRQTEEFVKWSAQGRGAFKLYGDWTFGGQSTFT